MATDTIPMVALAGVTQYELYMADNDGNGNPDTGTETEIAESPIADGGETPGDTINVVHTIVADEIFYRGRGLNGTVPGAYSPWKRFRSHGDVVRAVRINFADVTGVLLDTYQIKINLSDKNAKYNDTLIAPIIETFAVTDASGFAEIELFPTDKIIKGGATVAGGTVYTFEFPDSTLGVKVFRKTLVTSDLSAILFTDLPDA